MLGKTSAYVKGFDGETKWMYFLLVINKVSNSIKKELDCQPIYNKNF